jgi:hypothetical protein
VDHLWKSLYAEHSFPSVLNVHPLFQPVNTFFAASGACRAQKVVDFAAVRG